MKWTKGVYQNCNFIWHWRPRWSSIQTRRQCMVQACMWLNPTHWQIRSIVLDSSLLVLNTYVTYVERTRRGHKRSPTTLSLPFSLFCCSNLYCRLCLATRRRKLLRTEMTNKIKSKKIHLSQTCRKLLKESKRRSQANMMQRRLVLQSMLASIISKLQVSAPHSTDFNKWLSPLQEGLPPFFDVDQALEPPDQGLTEFEATWVFQRASLLLQEFSRYIGIDYSEFMVSFLTQLAQIPTFYRLV